MNRDLVAYCNVAVDSGVHVLCSDKVWEVWPRYPIKYENRQEVLMKIAILFYIYMSVTAGYIEAVMVIFKHWATMLTIIF